MKKINRLLICLLLTGLTVQTVAADKDSTAVVKKGWTFGALPSIGYNTDLGFQYGALAEVYYYGDGSTFPQYQHLLFVEANYTTKRSGLFRFFYDSKYLIPGVRVTFDLSYIPEAMSDFIGFNGYCSVYNPQCGKTGETGYLSRAFYKMKKEFFRATADFQGTITGNLSWNAGLGVFKYKTDEVNIDFLNRNKDEDKKLPTTDRQPTLYNYYDQWGIIKNNELHGGTHPFVRAGLTFDSRDRPNNPSRGIWADAFLTYFGAFGNQKEYNHLTLNAAFRHYVPLWRDNIIFAYRLGYQGSLWGNSPFYMKNYMATLFTKR
ncbi:MAG TPA: BamA/TamA family outer membrane protein, partial [Bacteroidales bacterium]|nr:BamA/TamA family outer membrane protein [Bacteroidales bacterium]